MVTSKYLSALGAIGSGPSMSFPHMATGQRELKLWRLFGEVCEMFVNTCHHLHLFLKSKVFALSVDQ